MTLKEFAETLAAAKARTKPVLRMTMREVAYNLRITAQTYIGEERPEWPRLAERTITEKFEEGYGGQVSATDPLLRTGELRSSIKDSIEVAGEHTTAVLSSDDPKAIYHEFGAGRIPPRPFLALAVQNRTPEALTRISLAWPEIFEG